MSTSIQNQPPTTNPNKALWEKGDFTRIAATMRESGEEVVASLGIGEGHRVLDLGSGDGTTAVPAAQLGAEVLAVDIASNLVAAGKARAREFGLTNLAFEEGDASSLRRSTTTASTWSSACSVRCSPRGRRMWRRKSSV